MLSCVLVKFRVAVREKVMVIPSLGDGSILDSIIKLTGGNRQKIDNLFEENKKLQQRVFELENIIKTQNDK